jgi:hypothetical protein
MSRTLRVERIGQRLLFIGCFCVLVVQGAALASAPPLAEIATPKCPQHEGKREFRSEMIQFAGDEAFVLAASQKLGDGCRAMAKLHLRCGGKSRSVALPDRAARYVLADFSPDRSRLLLSAEIAGVYPNEQFRNAMIGAVSTATGEIQWRNAWDLLGWQDCDASVRPWGFTAEGNIVVEARASTLIPARRVSCLRGPSLYEIDLAKGSASPLPDSIQIERRAKIAETRSRNCAADPDLVGTCFTVHGRLSRRSGTPSTRIWPVGTHRILGVSGEIIPDNVERQLRDDAEIFGDYRVCPLTPQQPGKMQSVCIDKAERLVAKTNRN